MSTNRRPMASQRPYTDIDDDNYDFDLERGIVVIVEGIAFGPFLLPEHALGWALKHKPDTMFKLMMLLDPEIV